MKPEIAVFSKAQPCSKKELWACFKTGPKGFARVQVAQAHSVIGLNAPRYMETKGYLVKETVRSVEHYSITPEGEVWLTAGIRSYTKNHPSELTDIAFHPDLRAVSATTARRVVRSR